MIETLEQISKLFEQLKLEAAAAEELEDVRVFSGAELPDIIRDVVDLLNPLLGTYEATFYLYLLRHSVIETGVDLIRVSVRPLQTTVVKSVRSDTEDRAISQSKVRVTLKSLEDMGVIRREGDATREGTLYRVLLPEEIEACRERRSEISRTVTPVIDEATEADFYNVRENRVKVYERYDYKCQYCGKQLTRFTVTLDHVKPVKDGGDNSFDNLLTACRECNSKKNAKLLGDFLAETDTLNP